ncbi:MAG: thymidine phosphorylase [Deltaproteobacteria bacterium]|nr:thymidine phosphorylase [Deltaproteobacteria bacterium]
MSFLPAQLIRAKRDGAHLADADLRAFIAGVTDDSIPDYQIAAMLMAIFFRGLDDRELATWADAMTRSGDVIDLSMIKRAKVDKHSTGGVGDKISIPLAPAVAACGVAVPMVSGRGLGHTGGTLDKLESIPGFKVNLSIPRFTELVDQLGVCLIGQTERIAPADKRLYALRDVTGTIESVPLIASSIMSKKLAEGIDGLVIDCKVGTGAFMKTLDDARRLCAAMMAIGKAAGKRVSCVLTDMDAPIGHAIGNALEIAESIDVMRGGGPEDTRELTLALGAEMLLVGGVTTDAADARARIAAALDDGRALAVFRALVIAQGGDPATIDDHARLPKAEMHTTVVAPQGGTVARIDAEKLGVASVWLGAGRRTKEDAVDPAAGLMLEAQIGDAVDASQPLCVLHHPRGLAPDRLEQALRLTREAFVIQPDDPATTMRLGTAKSRVLEIIREPS